MARGLLKTAPGGHHVRFAPDERLDPHRLGCLIEIDSPEHIAMVGHGNSRHIVFNGFSDEFLNAAGPVEEAVLRMDMEMDEIGVSHFENAKCISSSVKRIMKTASHLTNYIVIPTRSWQVVWS